MLPWQTCIGSNSRRSGDHDMPILGGVSWSIFFAVSASDIDKSFGPSCSELFVLGEISQGLSLFRQGVGTRNVRRVGDAILRRDCGALKIGAKLARVRSVGLQRYSSRILCAELCQKRVAFPYRK